jgi:signal transduction histidine kinase
MTIDSRVAGIIRRIVVCVLAFLAFADVSAAEPKPRSILVIDQSDAGGGPFYPAIFSAIKSTVRADSARSFSIFYEPLDFGRFPNPGNSESLRTYLRAKYRDRSIDVIVAVGSAALEYVLQSRAELWPGVPVAFAMVDELTLAGLTVPPDVTGRTVRLRFEDMVTTARAVVPGLEKIAMVGDVLEAAPVYRHLTRAIPAGIENLEVIDLIGLPMSELRQRLATLPDRTAIIYTSIFSDGAGTQYAPADALALIAKVANRPIVVSAETFVGPGGIGGYVMTPRSIGEAAARLALRLLDGERLQNISLAEENVKPIFDWRQLQRWGVDLSRLPAESEIRFRPLTAWDQYRWHILWIAAAFLLQTALILGLLHERRRRRSAETEARNRLSDLAHMNRYATAGELSASIAHELNQPLGSILANIEAAQNILKAKPPNLHEVKQILADIRRDDQRATDVIRRLRGLFKKTAFEVQEIELHAVLLEVIEFLSLEAAEHDVMLDVMSAPQAIHVNGDRTQLQQVIMNLVKNGIEASIAAANGQHKVMARIDLVDDGTVELSVSDTGRGIPEDQLQRVFEPFVTTKKDGMGMGLSITRTIIEAHRGRVWAERGIAGGAIFRFTLPRAGTHGASDRTVHLAKFGFREQSRPGQRKSGSRQINRAAAPMN